MQDVAANLRRLMARFALTIEDVIQRTGLDDRTIKGILAGVNKPHARTLNRLASGLDVSTDELFQDPSLLARRAFDRATNPVIEEVLLEQPQLFAGWTEADFDELYSSFGAGGALTAAGTAAMAQGINHKRELFDKVALLMETGEAQLLSDFVELLYERVQVRPAHRGSMTQGANAGSEVE